MIEIKLKEYIKTINDSNNFLINLNYSLIEIFGECSWAYIPEKDAINNIIYLGKVDLNIENGSVKVVVSIKYEQRGIIEKIFFQAFFDHGIPINEFKIKDSQLFINKDINEKIKSSVENVLNNFIMSEYTVKKYFESIYPFSNIKTKQFNIFNIEHNLNCIEVTGKAVCKSALEDLVQINIGKVFNLISVDTNSYIIQKFNKGDDLIEKKTYKNKYLTREKNFLEGYSLMDDKLILSKEAITLINILFSEHNAFLNKKNSQEIYKYLDGCNHINRALKYGKYIDSLFITPQINSLIPGIEANISYLNIDNSLYSMKFFEKEKLKDASELYEDEVEISFYLSGLEVMSDFSSNRTVCDKCSQSIYSIKKRVVQIVEKYTEFPELAKQFGITYDSRSSFLHSGKQTFKNTFNKIIPQLDNGSQTGTSQHLKGLSRENTKEYTCYVFREHLANILK